MIYSSSNSPFNINSKENLMPIEDKIDDLVAALDRNTAALEGQPAKGAKTTKAGKVAMRAEPEEELDEEEDFGKGKAKKAAPAKSAPAKGKAKKITYDQVRDAALDFSKTRGREELIGILDEFEAKTAKDLTDDQYGDFVARIEEREVELAEEE